MLGAKTMLTLGISLLGVAACGENHYSSVEELRDAVVEETGLTCPQFALGDPSRHSAGRATCSDLSASYSAFDLDIFESDDDQYEEILSFDRSPIIGCIAYGDRWLLTFFLEGESDYYCQLVADRMDAEVKQVGTR